MWKDLIYEVLCVYYVNLGVKYLIISVYFGYIHVHLHVLLFVS